MSASSKDIDLTIIQGGAKAHFGGVKGCGVLIWDVRMGIFEADRKPRDPRRALDWIKNTDWEDCIEQLIEPLEDPTYGCVTIDFDQKLVIDNNSYGASNAIYFDWFLRSLVGAVERDGDGLFPAKSVREHLRHRRIRITERLGMDPLVALTSTKPKEVLQELRLMVDEGRKAGSGGPGWAVLDMPEGWCHVVVGCE